MGTEMNLEMVFVGESSRTEFTLPRSGNLVQFFRCFPDVFSTSSRHSGILFIVTTIIIVLSFSFVMVEHVHGIFSDQSSLESLQIISVLVILVTYLVIVLNISLLHVLRALFLIGTTGTTTS